MRENETVKRPGRTFGAVLLGIAFVIVLVIGSFQYVTKYRLTDAGKVTSGDGSCEVRFWMRGEPDWPFGATAGRATVIRLGQKEGSFDFEIRDDGASLRESNWRVSFYPAGVEITLSGSEQEDEVIRLYYGDVEVFGGYTKEEIVREIKARYGEEISFEGREAGKYLFRNELFSFSAKDDFYITDTFEESRFAYLAERFSGGHNRYVFFEKDAESGEYIAVVTFYGRQPEEQEAFCNACCDLVEELQAIVGFTEIGYDIGGQRYRFVLEKDMASQERKQLYNSLYLSLEEACMDSYRDSAAAGSPESASNEDSGAVLWTEGTLEEEMPELWLGFTPDCTFRMKDGTLLKMTAVDRAAGSSYYVLLREKAAEETSVLNWDPYCGSGGEAKWITFLEDQKTGFSCLAYSGGSKGSLYRTEDGGKSFQEVLWPSAAVKLSDGMLYNPFIMPEEIRQQDGKLYLLVGQGPDGDYHVNASVDGVWDGTFAYGMYESEDLGKNWVFTGIQEK